MAVVSLRTVKHMVARCGVCLGEFKTGLRCCGCEDGWVEDGVRWTVYEHHSWRTASWGDEALLWSAAAWQGPRPPEHWRLGSRL